MAVLLQRQGFEIFRAAEYFTVSGSCRPRPAIWRECDIRLMVGAVSCLRLISPSGGDLYDFQKEAVEAMASHDFGTLAAPPGSGKTVMALGLAQ